MSLYSFLPPPGSALYGDLPPPETVQDPNAPLPSLPTTGQPSSSPTPSASDASPAPSAASQPQSNAAQQSAPNSWAARTRLMPTNILKRPAPPPAKPQKTAAQILAAKPTTVIVETKFVGGSTSDEENPDEAIRDEYDPAKPNDYMKWKAEQARLRRQAELQAEREREYRERMEHEAANPAPRIDTLTAASGEEAFLRRAALSGRAPPPAPPPVPRSPERSAPGPSDERPDFPFRRGGFSSSPSPPAPGPGPTSGAPSTSPPPAPGTGPKGLAFAAKLMQKMGWQAGSGLGKSNQGITTALDTRKTSNRQGVIVNAGAPGSMAGGLGGGRSRPLGAVQPTKILLLQNMVAPGEVDPDLQAETAEECQKYGRVDTCKVFEVTDGSVPPEEAVRIFVKFFAPESATKALNELNGRYFGGRMVRASYFDEERFARNELEPILDDY
eukprot:tig00000792_g4167.t1